MVINEKLTKQWIDRFTVAVKYQEEKVEKLEKELQVARLELESFKGQLETLQEEYNELLAKTEKT